MSFDLCVEKRAEHPFYIESIGIHIYTIEELCWFLYKNIYLIDASVASEELVSWIRDEIGMSRLAGKMAGALERPDKDISYFVLPVFQETGYLEADEMRRVRQELTKVQVQPKQLREKAKADHLLMSGRFSAAVVIYSTLLEKRSQGNLGMEFYASVWNNLGCAYARAFRFREAADTFLEGFRQTQSRELMRKYVSTLPLWQTDDEYRRTLKDIGADSVLTGRIQKYNASVAKEVEERTEAACAAADDPQTELDRLMAEYRRGAYF